MHDARGQPRIKCGFMVRAPGGALAATFGDISAGGAKFTVESQLGTQVEVLAGPLKARATVLQVLQGLGQFTYRVKFDDPKTGERLYAAFDHSRAFRA
jgi:hypothetical protein